jgi:hypothetical protein
MVSSNSRALVTPLPDTHHQEEGYSKKKSCNHYGWQPLDHLRLLDVSNEQQKQ